MSETVNHGAAHRPERWEIAAELFSAVSDRYSEAMFEEAIHPDLIFIKTGSMVINPANRRESQATASFNLISDYEAHSTHSGEALEIHVPINDIGDKESGLQRLEASINALGKNATERFIIIRHITADQSSRAYKLSDRSSEPYRELPSHGHYSRRGRRQFARRMIGKVRNFNLIYIQPR